MQRMVIVMPVFMANTDVRYLAVSLPYARQLVDHEKYLEVSDMPPPETRSNDLHRTRQGRAPRAPSLRSVVKWAVKCDIARRAVGQAAKAAIRTPATAPGSGSAWHHRA